MLLQTPSILSVFTTNPTFDPSYTLSIILIILIPDGGGQCVVWRCQVSAFPCAHVSIGPRLWRCDTVTVFALLHSWHSITAVTSPHTGTPDTSTMEPPPAFLLSRALVLFSSPHLWCSGMENKGCVGILSVASISFCNCSQVESD